MLSRLFLGLTLALAMIGTANAADNSALGRKLQALSKEAHSSKGLKLRTEAAKKYFWLSKSKKLCQYTEESRKKCEDALSFEESFNPKHICAGAESAHDKEQCLKEGGQIEKELEKLDKKKTSNPKFPKWIIDQANKPEKPTKSSGGGDEDSPSDSDGEK